MIKVYTLSDPRDITNIRYVGITSKKLKHRLSIHLSPTSLVSVTHKNNWIRSVIKDGLLPAINLIEEVDDHEWIEKEIFWIKYYRDMGFKLTNSTDGGDGLLNPSFDIRLKLSTSSSGDRNPNYGKKRSSETNDKINSSRRKKKNNKINDNDDINTMEKLNDVKT